MSTAGLYADVYDGGLYVGPCLLIGDLVPRLHHSDGVPVYYVTDHAEGGTLVTMQSGVTRRLAAYPSAWPAPGKRSNRYVYVKHERLPFDAPVPLYDQPEEIPDDERDPPQLH